MAKRIAAFLLAGTLFLSAGCGPRAAPHLEEDKSSSIEEHSSVPPQEEPEPPSAPPKPQRLTIVATGDLMVHDTQLWDAHNPETDTYDFSHCFANVEGDLLEGHLTIGNLETVFAGESEGYSTYPNFNTPDSFARALKESGFHFLVTANNHCLDQGEDGLLRTLEVLGQLGLAHTGTYAAYEGREHIAVWEVQGAKIAVLAYTFSTNGIPIPYGKPYMVNMIEEELILADLAAAKALEPDLILVLPHMGNEYELYPKDAFIWWMDFMLKNGADVVLASHPHVLQPMEVREYPTEDGGTRKGFVIYSLGNFISSQREPPCDAGIVLKLDFLLEDESYRLDMVRFVPTWVQFYDTAGNYLIRVLPVADALADFQQNGNSLLLRQWDATRLSQVHSMVTKLYLGTPVPPEGMQREYVFYSHSG